MLNNAGHELWPIDKLANATDARPLDFKRELSIGGCIAQSHAVRKS